ncbi:MAG: lipid-A-disaccharide synthase N-terminal domain-containing protein [Phycisphaerales bacterium]|nr:MAG: lipid-A-disaccharide synthase N-terminal domain-containing protein [Phycisphaerales bacterium]
MMDTFMLVAAATSDSSPTVASWMEKYFDVREPWELWWLFLGLAAQVVFFGRWIVQWIASERRGESYMPTFFWWISLAGATMLLIYFVGRREPIGILGQLTGWTVYSRNLYLIYRKQRRIIEDVAPGDGSSGAPA